MAAEMKAVLQYRASPRLRQRLADLELSTVVIEETDKVAFLREMRDAQILLHVLEPVTAAVIDAAPRLRLIQRSESASTRSTSMPPAAAASPSAICRGPIPRRSLR
jgi:phosphoglycerate dehydrogenase-like enzyme